jgi:dTDP-L-rhamnose 4-epimerase
MSGGEKVLVTGGAGFIGSHLVDRLVEAGRDVRVLDSLEPQVHGEGKGHRNGSAEYVEGNVLDRDLVDRCLEGADSVVHLAAQVGVGQSMYDIARYVEENCTGTAAVLERIAEHGGIGSLVVASSMSIYGEGQYACEKCGSEDVRVRRTLEDLQARNWEPRCADCGGEVRAIPTSELKPLEPDSVYATTKRDQEELVLVFGRSHGIRSIALRLFNTYGPRQSVSNPYTGVAAIFSSQLLSGNVPTIYEDGLQSRDFIHVSDIARAFHLALDADAGDLALNVGTGRSTSVLDVARVLDSELKTGLEPQIVNKFRHGDVRHCWADVTAIRDELGFEAEVGFEDGMRELVEWVRSDEASVDDRTAAARDELDRHGLVI